MKKLLLPLFIIPVLLFGMFFSCSHTQEEKIINDLLSDDQLEILENLGMPINSGENPPDITGYYNTNDLDCIEDTTGLFLQNLNYYWFFHDQSDVNVELDYYNLSGDSATGRGAFIFGEGSDFTVYMETEGEYSGYGITYTTVNLYSGTLTDSGIEDFTNGFIMTGKTGDDGDYFLMPVDGARIYEEGDDLAEELSSNPGFNVAADSRVIKEAVLKSLSSMGK